MPGPRVSEYRGRSGADPVPGGRSRELINVDLLQEEDRSLEPHERPSSQVTDPDPIMHARLTCCRILDHAIVVCGGRCLGSTGQGDV
jgi:hypothetical protein